MAYQVLESGAHAMGGLVIAYRVTVQRPQL
jgi:hypothetical protein